MCRAFVAGVPAITFVAFVAQVELPGHERHAGGVGFSVDSVFDRGGQSCSGRYSAWHLGSRCDQFTAEPDPGLCGRQGLGIAGMPSLPVPRIPGGMDPYIARHAGAGANTLGPSEETIVKEDR